jgi:hypothetical protein
LKEKIGKVERRDDWKAEKLFEKRREINIGSV